MTRAIGNCFILLGVLVSLVGCGGAQRAAPTGTSGVTGVVTLDDKPVIGASVMFVPMSPSGTSAGGVTDSSGKYVLMTGDGRASGALPGQYRVIISQFVKADGSTVLMTPDQSPMHLLTMGAKEVIPSQYSDVITSKLIATVPPEGGSLDFKLSSK